MIEHLRAHGFDAGPRQRPRLAGALAGLAAAPLLLLVLWRSGALAALARAAGHEEAAVALAGGAFGAVAGAIYGALFRRAANDRRGGWLLGMSFGFALWIGVSLLVRGLPERPLGAAAIGFYGAHVLFGLGLGLIFPPVHHAMMRKVSAAGPARGRGPTRAGRAPLSGASSPRG